MCGCELASAARGALSDDDCARCLRLRQTHLLNFLLQCPIVAAILGQRALKLR